MARSIMLQGGYLQFEEAKLELQNMVMDGLRLRWRFVQRQDGNQQRIYKCATHVDCKVRACISKTVCSGWQLSVSKGQLHSETND